MPLRSHYTNLLALIEQDGVENLGGGDFAL